MGRYDTDACNIDNSFTEPNSLKIQHLKKKGGGGTVLVWTKTPDRKLRYEDIQVSQYL